MMHGHEKSDSVIVAEKPANKAEQPAADQSAAEPTAAESVEPRAETKGNAGQQSMCRAQYLCVPKIRSANIGDEVRRAQAVM